VNRQNARNWDAFLQHVTDDVKSTEAVRDLCTPTGGTRVTCYDDLVDKECYVAVSRGRFRDIGYVDAAIIVVIIMGVDHGVAGGQAPPRIWSRGR